MMQKQMLVMGGSYILFSANRRSFVKNQVLVVLYC